MKPGRRRIIVSRLDSAQRGDILEAAIRAFAARGLRGATIRLVAREARVNSALLYYYFENKLALFTEAVRTVLHGFLAYLRTRRRPLEGAEERLGFLVDGVFGYYTRYPERMRLMAGVVSNHPELMGRALNSILQNKTLVPLGILLEGMKKGELRRMQPVEAWWSILSLSLFSLLLRDVLGHVSHARIPLPSPELADRRKHIIGLLLHGFSPQPTHPRKGGTP